MTNLKNIETAHLSMVERYLLTFIKYKTNNHHTFFMNNESIAQQIGCKVSSTKVLINKLIREGYILKMEGNNGRRELALSGKYYVPLDGVDMSNQEKSLLKQLETTLNDYEKAEDLDKSSQDIKDRYKCLRETYEYMKQKSHSRRLLAQIEFVSQFVSQLLEFLLIKENGRNPHWISDRDHMATHCNGLLFFLVNYKLAMLLKGRVTDFWLHLPAEIKKNSKDYAYDHVIRVPDIITGIVSSMKFTREGIQMDKPKHFSLFDEVISDNPRVITLEYIYQKDGKGYFQRTFWRKPIEGCNYEPFDPDNCKRFKELPL